MSAAPSPLLESSRQELRLRLLAERSRLVASGQRGAIETALVRELRLVVAELEPKCLGLYWPYRAEFNVHDAWVTDEGLAKSALALPFARRRPIEMHYRLWDGLPPKAIDELGIPASDGSAVVPDVVVVPCVGYTDSGLRLGYGGGYFDRWLSAHPQACAVGLAITATRLSEDEFQAGAHDIALSVIVTERGPV